MILKKPVLSFLLILLLSSSLFSMNLASAIDAVEGVNPPISLDVGDSAEITMGFNSRTASASSSDASIATVVQADVLPVPPSGGGHGKIIITCVAVGVATITFSWVAPSGTIKNGTVQVTCGNVPAPDGNGEETGGTGESTCLIATAAFGGALAPEVQMIHDIRDNKLMSTEFGQDFMSSFDSVYYTFALTVANWQYENPAFKESVRVLITPAITILSLMTLAEEGSEFDAWFLMSTVIALNMGLYIAGPIVGIFFLQRHFKK